MQRYNHSDYNDLHQRIGIARNVRQKMEIKDLHFDVGLTPTSRHRTAPNIMSAKQQLIKARRGQGIFKNNVRLNEKKCRVTGVTNSRLLIASHIKPWADSNDKEKLDGCNGLLLSPHVDKLFDKGLIGFRDNGDIIISSKLDQQILDRWGIDKAANVGAFKLEQCAYLEYHRTKRCKK